MYYIYIIRSLNSSEHIYVGKTSNLNKRLADHNAGTTAHTAKYAPWKLVMFLASEAEEKIIEFEKYLKSHSGSVQR